MSVINFEDVVKDNENRAFDKLSDEQKLALLLKKPGMIQLIAGDVSDEEFDYFFEIGGNTFGIIFNIIDE